MLKNSSPHSLEIITPATRLIEGQHALLRAVAHFNDGTTQDVTAECEWAVAHAKTARFSDSNPGEVVALTYGQSMIFASWQGCNGSIEVEVRPILVDVFAQLPSQNLLSGETYLCHAYALFSNGRSRLLHPNEGVVWCSDAPDVVGFDQVDHLKAKGIGGATVTVSFGGFEKSVGVVVANDHPYVSLLLPEVIPSPMPGESVDLPIKGVMNSGDVVALSDELSWECSDPDVGTISASGLFSAKQAGVCHITVSAGQLSASFSVQVIDKAELLHLQIEKPDFLSVGEGESLVVRAYYSDGSNKEVTDQVRWCISREDVLTIGKTGVINAKMAGQAHLYALYSGLAAEAYMRVISPPDSRYQTNTLPWSSSQKEERLLQVSLGAVFTLMIAIAFVVPFVTVPDISREAREEIPPRLAKLILQKKQEVPPPEVKQEEKKEEEPEKQEELVEVDEKEADAPQQSVAEAREKAAKSGLLALTSELNELHNDTLLEELSGGTPLELEMPGTLEKEVEGGRKLITSTATRRSGGIDTSRLGKVVGNSQLVERQVTKVDAPVYIEHEKEVDGGDDGRPSRTYEEIQLVFEKNKGRIYSIYNRALRKNPALKGKVVFEITITPDGSVTDCQVVSSELGDKALEKKLMARIMLFKFEKKEVDEIIVTYPIEFLPS